MTPNEYVKLLDKIQREHSMMSKKGRSIKYVSCNYDTRDNSIYRVSLREWFDSNATEFPREFVIGKELRVKEMYEDICKWLEETYK